MCISLTWFFNWSLLSFIRMPNFCCSISHRGTKPPWPSLETQYWCLKFSTTVCFHCTGCLSWESTSLFYSLSIFLCLWIGYHQYDLRIIYLCRDEMYFCSSDCIDCGSVTYQNLHDLTLSLLLTILPVPTIFVFLFWMLH